MCKYEIIPHWSDDDDAYIAEVPELNLPKEATDLYCIHL